MAMDEVVGFRVREEAGRLISLSLDVAVVLVMFPSSVLASIEFWLLAGLPSEEVRGRLAGVMAAVPSLSDAILSKFRCVR